jgi:hypothetical protein
MYGSSVCKEDHFSTILGFVKDADAMIWIDQCLICYASRLFWFSSTEEAPPERVAGEIYMEIAIPGSRGNCEHGLQGFLFFPDSGWSAGGKHE